MELVQAQQILEIAFKRERRAYTTWQRVQIRPSKTDTFEMLKDHNYISNLELKQKQLFASCKYWEDRIRDGSYKTHQFDNSEFSYKKYYKLKS